MGSASMPPKIQNEEKNGAGKSHLSKNSISLKSAERGVAKKNAFRIQISRKQMRKLIWNAGVKGWVSRNARIPSKFGHLFVRYSIRLFNQTHQFEDLGHIWQLAPFSYFPFP